MKTERYSLRQVVELTGISEFTLRGWENRYGAFAPDRSDTGRRRYSAGDLQKAILLRELLKRDFRIGEIAGLGTAKLRSLLGSESETARPEVDSAVKRLIGFALVQEWDQLERELARAAGKGVESVWQVCLPLLGEMARLVGAGQMSIAQEHILSALLKEQLFRLKAAAPVARGRARVVVAAPEGDFHELGILVAHCLVSLAGVHSLFLGPNSPKDQLCETALRFGATHVMLGTTVSRREGAKEDLFAYVNFLDRHLPRNVAVWLGGRNTAGFGAAPDRELLILKDFHTLEAELQKIRAR